MTLPSLDIAADAAPTPGVAPAISEAMHEAQADVLCEDNLLQRTCTHGVRHPVARLRTTDLREGDVYRHERLVAPLLGTVLVDCCGCCEAWLPAPEETP